MASLYHYAHGTTQSGPWTANQMRAYAAAGRIAPQDTIWQDGTTHRVLASDVRTLFQVAAAVPTPPPHDIAAVVAAPTLPAEPPAAAPEVPAPVKLAPAGPGPAAKAPRPKRVVSIKGGILMGQDGVDVKFKKKCEKCGFEDPCRSSAAIRTGMTRIPFYCRTCKKPRAVEISGMG